MYIYVCILYCVAMRREERDAWVEALRHILQPANFDTQLLINRYMQCVLHVHVTTTTCTCRCNIHVHVYIVYGVYYMYMYTCSVYYMYMYKKFY